MEEIRIKDVIFSFRHIYQDNLKKLNKRLKKHITIDSKLIDDIIIYIENPKENEERIGVKYIFKKGSIGSFVKKTSENLGIPCFLNDEISIKKSNNIYYSNSKGINVKDEKISRELESIYKEEFYSKICEHYSNKDINVYFTPYEITFSTNKFLVCYNTVGDIIYVYTPDNIEMRDILNTSVDIDFDDYHKKIIKPVDKIVDCVSNEEDIKPGDYTIKEKDKAITLYRVKKDRLNKYI